MCHFMTQIGFLATSEPSKVQPRWKDLLKDLDYHIEKEELSNE